MPIKESTNDSITEKAPLMILQDPIKVKSHMTIRDNARVFGIDTSRCKKKKSSTFPLRPLSSSKKGKNEK